MRVWITGDDTRIGSDLLQALDGIGPTPVSIDIVTLLKKPALVAGTLILAGFAMGDQIVRRYIDDLRHNIAHGEIIVFSNSANDLPPEVLPIESITPATLRRIVVSTVDNIELRDRLSRVELEREAALRLSMELISGMAHDLRGPLNSILGFSELLEGYLLKADDKKQARYASNIGASGRTLLQLIDDIVDLSRIDLGTVDPRIEIVEVSALLNDLIRLVREKAQKQGVSIGWESNGDNLRGIRIDRRRFRQAIYLLMTSQIELQTSGARLSISVREEDSNTRLRFDVDPGSDSADPRPMERETPSLPAWQRLYVERVLAMHGAEVSGWGSSTHSNGAVEIRIPGPH